MKQITYFDIETEGLSLRELMANMPEFKAPSNYKDPMKIAESINAQKLEYMDRAALSALTGHVLCIGVDGKDGFGIIENTEEKDLLENFWAIAANAERLIGFNSHGFDLPFLIRRSIKNGVPVPLFIREGRYWARNSLDLMEIWTCGNREERISLDALSKFLGVGAKNGDGKDFAALWHKDKPSAVKYLENDLKLLVACAQRMGVV